MCNRLNEPYDWIFKHFWHFPTYIVKYTLVITYINVNFRKALTWHLSNLKMLNSTEISCTSWHQSRNWEKGQVWFLGQLPGLGNLPISYNQRGIRVNNGALIVDAMLPSFCQRLGWAVRKAGIVFQHLTSLHKLVLENVTLTYQGPRNPRNGRKLKDCWKIPSLR